RQIQAVEMESAGVYKAAHGRVPFLAIRGISDVVGFKRHPDWTAYACHTAAAFTRAFLLARPIRPRTVVQPQREAEHGAAEFAAPRTTGALSEAECGPAAPRTKGDLAKLVQVSAHDGVRSFTDCGDAEGVLIRTMQLGGLQVDRYSLQQKIGH